MQKLQHALTRPWSRAPGRLTTPALPALLSLSWPFRKSRHSTPVGHRSRCGARL